MNGVNGLGGLAYPSRLNGPNPTAPVDAQARQEADGAEASKFQQTLQSQNVKMGAYVMSFIMNDLLEQILKDPNDPSAV